MDSPRSLDNRQMAFPFRGLQEPLELREDELDRVQIPSQGRSRRSWLHQRPAAPSDLSYEAPRGTSSSSSGRGARWPADARPWAPAPADESWSSWPRSSRVEFPTLLFDATNPRLTDLEVRRYLAGTSPTVARREHLAAELLRIRLQGHLLEGAHVTQPARIALGLYQTRSQATLARHVADCVGETHGAGGGGVSFCVPGVWWRHPVHRVHHGAWADPEDSDTPRRAAGATTRLAGPGDRSTRRTSRSSAR